jgi:hypothetical protein
MGLNNCMVVGWFLSVKRIIDLNGEKLKKIETTFFLRQIITNP